MFIDSNGGAGVNVNVPVTLGSMSFSTTGGASLSYTISGSSPITFDGLGHRTATITVAAGVTQPQTISTSVFLANTDLVVTNNMASSALTMSGTVTGAANRKLTLAAGNLILSNAGDALGAIGLTRRHAQRGRHG